MELQSQSKEILQQLGAGQSIQSICTGTNLTRTQFDVWWQAETAARVPDLSGTKTISSLRGQVEIVRDERGVPHIYAGCDEDLFFGLGMAMAQDRLWQLDYLRRKAQGRLAEILGAEMLEQDVLVHTVGIQRIAEQELAQLPQRTLELLEAFARGVNAVIDKSQGRLPIEFDLLAYAPEPWAPLHSLAVWGELRWYLTGRLPVIALPELAKRSLGDGALYQAFLTAEAGDESILPPGSYPAPRHGRPRGDAPTGRVGETVGDPQEGAGSNNWVAAGSRTTTGTPLLASDPHIAFGSLSCWYQAHLCGGSFNVAGAGYVGVPGILFGRNEAVAWGVTNNICSQRDLYQEKTDPAHPGCYLYDGVWEPMRELRETIQIRGSEAVHKTIRFSRNGPIVDELLPQPAKATGPVSLRWLGATPGDEITCMLKANAALGCDEFRAALGNWRVPTLSFVFAGVDGHIGYQCAGRIPIRHNWGRGYRPGWEPVHQWQGVIPLEGMPALADPPQGWIRTANNRTAPEDYPYPLSGTWSSGHRAKRIRQLLEESEKFSSADFVHMQYDVLSLRAVEATPRLLECLETTADVRIRRAADVLQTWDHRMAPDSAGAAIFDLFFRHWMYIVAAERFADDLAPHMAEVVAGLALALLVEDAPGWFVSGNRIQKVIAAFDQALDELAERLGPDLSQWTWGRLHTITLHHPLSGRGDLGQLLDRGGYSLGGNGFTVCNTGADANYRANLGANYRIIADLSASAPALWTVDAAGQSGHPGSTHYCDQLTAWLDGNYHQLALDREHVNVWTTTLIPPASTSP
jgi:penicillin amidase